MSDLSTCPRSTAASDAWSYHVTVSRHFADGGLDDACVRMHDIAGGTDMRRLAQLSKQKSTGAGSYFDRDNHYLHKS